MKGLELPISTVVVVAVVVLVFVVVSAFFLAQSGTKFDEIGTRSDFSTMCTQVKCNSDEVTGISKESKFYKTCSSLYGSVSMMECLRACGCSDDALRQGVSAQSVSRGIDDISQHCFFRPGGCD